MLGVHLLSGLVFGLKLDTEGFINKNLFILPLVHDTADGQQHQQHYPCFYIFQIYSFVWLSSITFFSIASSVQPRVAKPHLLVHSLIILLRLASITNDRCV
jgi:hypothetical protein